MSCNQKVSQSVTIPNGLFAPPSPAIPQDWCRSDGGELGGSWRRSWINMCVSNLWKPPVGRGWIGLQVGS